MLKDVKREAWGWLERLAQDLCYTLRQLRKSPGFIFSAMELLSLMSGLAAVYFPARRAARADPMPQLSKLAEKGLIGLCNLLKRFERRESKREQVAKSSRSIFQSERHQQQRFRKRYSQICHPEQLTCPWQVKS